MSTERMSGLDLSTKAGVLRFAELRRNEMALCWERLGRFESNGFSFCGYVFATHAVKVPADRSRIEDWKTGAKLGRVTGERVRMPTVLKGVIPADKETMLFSVATRHFAKLTRSIGTLIMTEIWHVNASPEERAAMPERLEDYEGPDRGEALYVQLEHSATGRRLWVAEICRNPTRLGPWVERQVTDAEGRLVDLAEWRS